MQLIAAIYWDVDYWDVNLDNQLTEASKASTTVGDRNAKNEFKLNDIKIWLNLLVKNYLVLENIDFLSIGS
mgnify:CR=1 FL=1